MKVYIVISYVTIWGVYASKEKAEKEREKAQMDANFRGDPAFYTVDEYEVKED